MLGLPLPAQSEEGESASVSVDEVVAGAEFCCAESEDSQPIRQDHWDAIIIPWLHFVRLWQLICDADR